MNPPKKRKGKVSFREQLEKALKKPISDILQTHFRYIKEMEDALACVQKITKNALKTTPPTLRKTVIESCLPLADYPFTKEEKKERILPFGKQSTKSKLEEHFKKPIKDILIKHFKGIETAEKAVDTLRDATRSKITASVLTIMKMIYEEKLDLSLFPFAAIKEKQIEAGKGKHSKTKNFDFSKLQDLKDKQVDEAAKEFDMSVATLKKIYLQAVDEKKINPHEFKWFRTKGQRKETTLEQETKIQEDLINVYATCECGHTWGWKSRPSTCGPELVLGLKGHRCPKCCEFGKMIARFTVNGTQLSKMVIHEHNINSEEFIDNNGKTINNPFPGKQEKELNISQL